MYLTQANCINLVAPTMQGWVTTLKIKKKINFANLQDVMTQLFSQQSVADIGTLYFFKEIFKHRNFKSHLMHNFKHVEHFLHVSLVVKLITSYTIFFNFKPH